MTNQEKLSNAIAAKQALLRKCQGLLIRVRATEQRGCIEYKANRSREGMPNPQYPIHHPTFPRGTRRVGMGLCCQGKKLGENSITLLQNFTNFQSQ